MYSRNVGEWGVLIWMNFNKVKHKTPGICGHRKNKALTVWPGKGKNEF